MKKSLFFFSLSFLFLALQVQAQDISVSQNPATESYGQLPYAGIDAITITHSVSQTIITGNSVSCNAGGLHTNNSYFRAFNLTNFGITEDFNISMVEIGVEQAIGNGGTQPITVYLYTSSQAFPGGYPASLTQIGTANINVPDQSLTLFQIPVTGTAPAGSELVVEIFTPDGQTTGNSFFIGSNNLGQSGPSYLMAADCGVTVPTDVAAIGFPGMHIVMNVTGDVAGGGNIFTEDFEGFIVGQQVACQDPVNWTTWSNLPCSSEDAYISSNHAFSGTKSAVIVSANDLVKPLGDKTSGKWYISFMVYIPAGKSGYFNTLTGFTPNTNEWAHDCFFDAGGAGRLDITGGGGGGTIVNFTWTVAQWNQVVIIVDLDSPTHVAEFWIGTNPSNFTQVATWDWTNGGTKTNRIAANDFYGFAATDEMYFDDYSFGDTMPPIVPVELTSFTANVNNLSQVVLNWETATEVNNQGFEIERRTETSEFRTIGFVPGFGTTTEPTSYNFTDVNAEQGINFYRLKQVDYNGTYAYSDIVEVDVTAPLTFNLDQNYPNPFNPSTSIKYSVPESGNIRLSVFNVVGEEVAVLAEGFSQAGSFEVTFDASNLSTGVYLYKLQSANSVQTKKMMLLK